LNRIVMIIVAVVAIAVVGPRLMKKKDSVEDTHSMLVRQSQLLNAKLPARPNAVITVTSTEVEGTTMRVNYDVDDSVQFRGRDLDGNTNKMVGLACGNESLKGLLKQNVSPQLRFHWRESGTPQQQDLTVPAGACA